MHTLSIISGKFARVYTGNMTDGWMVEGDDLQARANANINSYWLTDGRDCPIYDRNVDGHALVVDGSVAALFTSLEAAQNALNSQATYYDKHQEA